MPRAALWTQESASRETGAVSIGEPWVASGVSIDTRTLERGDLFVALKDQRDGHQFLKQAENAGAAAALISDRDALVETKALPSLVCADTQKGLEALGRVARARTNARVIAVTGSVGKTGTKEMLRRALAPSGLTHCSEKSYNNLWGVPLSLARMPVETEFGIFEIGMNHSEEVRPLSHLVAPDVAIITTVAPVHLEFFESVEEIADAKAEIFEGLKPGGTAILNIDNPYYERLKSIALADGVERIVTFGTAQTADIRLLKIEMNDNGSRAEVDVQGTRMSYEIGCPGKHWAVNSLAVIAAVEAVGADLPSALISLRDMAPPKGRGQKHVVRLSKGGEIKVVDESYNANPASMKAALETLATISVGADGKRIAVIGDMRELGEKSDQLHQDLSCIIEELEIDQVFCCGPHMVRLKETIDPKRLGGYAEASSELIEPLRAVVSDGDVVMVKGSLGTNMAPLVSTLLELDREKLSKEYQ